MAEVWISSDSDKVTGPRVHKGKNSNDESSKT
jgi:hypothetical protein